MTEADDTSTPMPGRPERVPDCTARLEILYQIMDEEADDPDEDKALVTAWNTARWDAVATLVAAHARTIAELDAKAEWIARMIDEIDPHSYAPEMAAAVARDARALAAAAR